jgi:glutathione S-transferase
MESALRSHTWLAGGGYSLADAGLTPYVNRMAMLRLHRLWEDDRPRVTDWYARVKARPNYAASVLKYDPADRIKLMQSAGDAAWPKVKEAMALRRRN